MQEAFHVGGNLNNGSNDGFFYWNGNNEPSNSNWNMGSRNFLKCILILDGIPYRLVKMMTLRIACEAEKPGSYSR